MKDSYHRDEASWMADLAAGEPAARSRFYDEYQRDVLGWCRRLGGGIVEPQDAAQDVFIVAFGRLDSFRGESSLRTWMFGITRRVLANNRRKARMRRWRETLMGSKASLTPDRGPGPLAETIRSEKVRQVHKCLDTLSDKHREVLVLCSLEGRSGQEASEILGVPEATVYSRLHYARAAFRKVARRNGLATGLGRGNETSKQGDQPGGRI